MKRALVLVLPIALVPVVAMIACGESNDRAPAAPSCATGVNCNVGPGVVSSGGSDTGTTDGVATDAVFEVGDGGVAVSAIVRPLSSFVTDPTTITTFDTTVTLRAPRAGGGSPVEATMAVVDGTYTLNGVGPAVGAQTWIEVWKGGVLRTFEAASLPPSATLQLPIFTELLPQTTWNVVAPTTTYPTGAATVVVHVYGPGGTARLAGARGAAAAGTTTRGPFYDDGADISPTATATGARGTIVYLGITGMANYPLNLTVGTKSYATVNVPVSSIPPSANLVTHIALVLD